MSRLMISDLDKDSLKVRKSLASDDTLCGDKVKVIDNEPNHFLHHCISTSEVSAEKCVVFEDLEIFQLVQMCQFIGRW